VGRTAGTRRGIRRGRALWCVMSCRQNVPDRRRVPSRTALSRRHTDAAEVVGERPETGPAHSSVLGPLPCSGSAIGPTDLTVTDVAGLIADLHLVRLAGGSEDQTGQVGSAFSPTAVAQCFVEPERTSPAANRCGTSVSSRLSIPRGWARQDEPFRDAADGVVATVRARQCAGEEERSAGSGFAGHLVNKALMSVAACPASVPRTRDNATAECLRGPSHRKGC
jgi:hypothetical protein